MLMGEVFKVIIEFFTNKGLHIGYRLSLAILILFGILFLNDFLGVSRNYMLNSKLQQIIELKQIDPDILKDDTTVNYRYLQLKNEIINNKSKTEEIFIRINKFFSSLKPASTIPSRNPVTSVIPSTTSNRSLGAQTSTSSIIHSHLDTSNPKFDWSDFSAMISFYVLITVIIAVLVYGIFADKSSFKSKIGVIVVLIIAVPVIYFIGLFYKWAINLIPIFTNYEWINYLIDFLIPASVIIFILSHISISDNTKKPEVV